MYPATKEPTPMVPTNKPTPLKISMPSDNDPNRNNPKPTKKTIDEAA